LLNVLQFDLDNDLDLVKMTSATREGEGLASDDEAERRGGASDTSELSENSGNSKSRRRQRPSVVQGAKSLVTKPSGVEPPSHGSLSTSENECAQYAVEKGSCELASGGERESPAQRGGDAVRGGLRIELAPPTRSKSSDRRLSMSIIDTVFRRRRRPSLAPSAEESSDSEMSTDNTVIESAASTTGRQVWRSDVCRQLNKESASTSSTVELDEVDQRPSGSWQHKVRRRIRDISIFNKPNNPGTERFQRCTLTSTATDMIG